MSVTTLPSTPIAQEFTTPVIESAKEVFAKMLSWEVELANTAKSKRLQSQHEITGMIGYSGALQGTLLLGFDRQVALAAAEVLLGTKPSSIDADVMDLVGELTNLVGGNAKERMDCEGIQLGLPTVICGQGPRIGFPPGTMVDLLSFNSPHGQFSAEVAVRRIDCGC